MKTSLNSATLWAVTPCCWGTARLRPELSFLPNSARFGLLFDLENGGDVLCRNVDMSPKHMTLQSRKPYRPKNLKSTMKVLFVTHKVKKILLNCGDAIVHYLETSSLY
jgi:hypothetical protein